MRNKWKESTWSRSETDIARYLYPAFGERLLHAVRRADMQRFLEQKAASYSASIVGHLRWHLNSIYKMAQSDGIVGFNPAAALFIPACRPAKEKQVMTVEQILDVLGALELQERVIFRMAVFDGMRPGEIFAIQLGKLRSNAVVIDQRVYDGAIDLPKGRKGKNTTRLVALAPGTLHDLTDWVTCLPSQAPDAYLFPSEAGTPLGPHNLWKRTFQPRLDELGLGVSLAVYAISGLDQKIEAVTKLESEVMKASPTPKLQSGKDL